MNRTQTALCALLVVMLFACNQKNDDATAAPNKDLASVFDKYWDERSRLYPLDATQQGDNRYNDLLVNDQTQAFRDTLKAFYTGYKAAIKKFDYDKLDENDRISYDIFTYEVDMQLKALEVKVNNNGSIQASWMIPTQQFWGLTLTMGQLGSGDGFQPFKTTQDYDNWLGRVKSYSLWTDSAIANFRKGIAAGVVLPRVLVEKMIPQYDAMVVADPTKSLFYGPISKLPKDFSTPNKERLTAAYKQAILNELVPSYKKLSDFLKNEYLPKARATTGIGAIPEGDKIYNYLVKYWTTTDKTPDEIYQTGLSEVKRITTTMDSLKNAVGFKGDLKAFFEFMKTDKRFTPYKTPQDVLDAFVAIHKKMEPSLKKMYSRVPKTPFEVRQTEAFRAASASAEYSQGSPDGARPGIFYVPIVDATKYNTTSGMESLFLHEAIPGHHYQISLQQENNSLPKFRRFAWYGAYGEGYALYCESLGKELGLYTDPYQHMGALGDEMHRAIRLVVDVGMHSKNMTREQAIKYMMDNEAISEDGAVAEIERYMAIPGQALSYKIGALKIRELREKYRERLGNKFNLAAFHDEFLKDGCMPLAIVEKKMDAWAKRQ